MKTKYFSANVEICLREANSLAEILELFGKQDDAEAAHLRTSQAVAIVLDAQKALPSDDQLLEWLRLPGLISSVDSSWLILNRVDVKREPELRPRISEIRSHCIDHQVELVIQSHSGLSSSSEAPECSETAQNDEGKTCRSPRSTKAPEEDEAESEDEYDEDEWSGAERVWQALQCVSWPVIERVQPSSVPNIPGRIFGPIHSAANAAAKAKAVAGAQETASNPKDARVSEEEFHAGLDSLERIISQAQNLIQRNRAAAAGTAPALSDEARRERASQIAMQMLMELSRLCPDDEEDDADEGDMGSDQELNEDGPTAGKTGTQAKAGDRHEDEDILETIRKQAE